MFMGVKMCEGCSLNKGDYCYKIGGDISVFGICEEDERMIEEPCQKHSKSNKYERNKKYKHKLERIANHPKRYPAGAYYVIDRSCHWNLYQDYYDWVHENGKYVKRCYRANHAPGYSGWLKRQASKKFRRYNGELANGCAYKKIFDYWWELI
jgi:hypothetical protein